MSGSHDKPRCLTIASTEISNDGLGELNESEYLFLSSTYVLDNGVAALANCRHLTTLDLWGTATSPDRLRWIAKHRSRETLSLSDTNLSVVSVLVDSQSKLHWLNLDRTNIGDDLIEAANDKSHRNLTGGGTNVSKDSVPAVIGLTTLEEFSRQVTKTPIWQLQEIDSEIESREDWHTLN